MKVAHHEFGVCFSSDDGKLGSTFVDLVLGRDEAVWRDSHHSRLGINGVSSIFTVNPTYPTKDVFATVKSFEVSVFDEFDWLRVGTAICQSLE